MAVVGLSLILASVVWVVFRRPPFLETLWALIRSSPSIQQPPSTARPSPPSRGASPARDHPPTPSIITSSVDDHTPESISLPGLSTQDDGDGSPQTTPRATASSGPSHAVPSFNLVSDPSEDVKAMPQPPRLVPVPSRNPGGASGLMAPPPRPPTLNALSPNGAAARFGASLLAAPGRPSPLPNRNYDRQPGSSTLAPPPTHSSKPAKPSRKVILEPGRSPLDWARIANHPTSDLRNLPAGTPYLRVTPSMLKKQTGRKGKDAWTALNGRVYNISPYLPYHPGGEPELLRCAGRDGTKLFGEIHPWVNYETMLASSMIGLFVEENEAASSEMDDMD